MKARPPVVTSAAARAAIYQHLEAATTEYEAMVVARDETIAKLLAARHELERLFEELRVLVFDEPKEAPKR